MIYSSFLLYILTMCEMDITLFNDFRIIYLIFTMLLLKLQKRNQQAALKPGSISLSEIIITVLYHIAGESWFGGCQPVLYKWRRTHEPPVNLYPCRSRNSYMSLASFDPFYFNSFNSMHRAKRDLRHVKVAFWYDDCVSYVVPRTLSFLATFLESPQISTVDQ